MNATVVRSVARGRVRAPGSKSYTIRAALCAAMAGGRSFIADPLESDDCAAAFQCAGELGAGVEHAEGGVVVHGGQLRVPREPLWCRESGATFRFLAAVAATLPGTTVLLCAPSLARRPLQPLLHALEQLGAGSEFDASTGRLVVRGKTQSSGRVVIRGDVSSQFLSALLLSGPRYDSGLTVELATAAVSERYVQMTLECMRRFGANVDVAADGRVFRVHGSYAPTRYAVEGDWSGAAAVLGLGAMAGDICVERLRSDSLQADVAMLALLRSAGARVVTGENSVTASQAPLHAFEVQLEQAIDLLPVACAVAAVASGVTTLRGISRARDKESDRVASMAEGLSRLGVKVQVLPDRMHIWGGSAHGGTVSAAGDHRIAMAFGVLGPAVGDVTVEGAESVSKTYPAFWEMLAGLGVEVTLRE